MDNYLTNKETDILISNLIHFSERIDYNSYSYIRNTLNQLLIPFPAISIKTGKLLFRSRRHLNQEEFFINISDISHRVDIYKITEFGRANEPCQSIFYCSDRNEIAMAETSPILRKNANIDLDILTTGIWEVKQEIRVASLLNYPLFDVQNATQQFLDTNAKKVIESFRDENTEQLLKLHEFISSEFSKPSEEDPSKYLISCAFANYLYSNNGYDTCLKKISELDGLLFPSTIYPHFGMNLALLPKVVEESKIILTGVRRSALVKKDATHYIEEETIDAKYIDLNTDKIKWI